MPVNTSNGYSPHICYEQHNSAVHAAVKCVLHLKKTHSSSMKVYLIENYLPTYTCELVHGHEQDQGTMVTAIHLLSDDAVTQIGQ